MWAQVEAIRMTQGTWCGGGRPARLPGRGDRPGGARCRPATPHWRTPPTRTTCCAPCAASPSRRGATRSPGTGARCRTPSVRWPRWRAAPATTTTSIASASPGATALWPRARVGGRCAPAPPP
jgi:hypothetical protein